VLVFGVDVHLAFLFIVFLFFQIVITTLLCLSLWKESQFQRTKHQKGIGLVRELRKLRKDARTKREEVCKK